MYCFVIFSICVCHGTWSELEAYVAMMATFVVSFSLSNSEECCHGNYNFVKEHNKFWYFYLFCFAMSIIMFFLTCFSSHDKFYVTFHFLGTCQIYFRMSNLVYSHGKFSFRAMENLPFMYHVKFTFYMHGKFTFHSSWQIYLDIKSF